MSGAPYSIKLDEYKPELNPGPSSSSPAARKSDRACDFCRRRKTRCDGAPTLKSKCSNCKRNQCPCTYLEASRPRGPPKAFVTALEDRTERFERLFRRLRPDTDFTDILGPPIPRGSWKDDEFSCDRTTSDASSNLGHSSASQAALLPEHLSLDRRKMARASASDDDSSSDEDRLEADWPRRRLTVRGTTSQVQLLNSDADSPAGTGSTTDSPKQEHDNMDASFAGTGSTFGAIGGEGSVRFLGKSSMFTYVKATRRYMRATAGDDGFHEPGRGSDEVWTEAGKIGTSNIPKSRRPRFWQFAPWELAWERKSSSLASTSEQGRPAIFVFPPSDLTLPLLALYFHHTNTIFPFLHAPTFYSQFRDGLHLRDAQFAGVVWAMLAVASRWSEDHRVLWDGWGSDNAVDVAKMKDEEIEWASAGWRFFHRSIDGLSYAVTSLDPPSLFDLQCCAIGSIFLRGSSVGPAAWIIVGTGLRKAMDVGAHRKKVYGSEPSLESELWKRAFWTLVLFDRLGSASLGRPCCVREEEFDLDLPLEVDDEYWIPSDPSQRAFQQPRGKPSMVSGLVSMLKISQIMAHALRTIYCTDKSKVLLGLVSHDWQGQIVSQLNAALDEWVESVPQHLRWSSGIQDDIFQNQSATIYTTYYLVLILIYRPFSQGGAFIPDLLSETAPKPGKGFPFPAGSICTSAAHSAIRIVEEQTRRGLWNIPNMIHVAHICAVVQLMSMYAPGSQGSSPTSAPAPGARNVDFLAAKVKERERCMQDVEKCIRCLEMAEPRWIMARKFLASLKSALPESVSDIGYMGLRKPDEHPQQMDLDVAPPIQAQVGLGAALPKVSSTWSNAGTAPTPESPASHVNEAEQALKNHANWRWFRESERLAQQRFGGGVAAATNPAGPGAHPEAGGILRVEPMPLRHHVVVPSSRHGETPTPMPMLGRMAPASAPLQRNVGMDGFGATGTISEVGISRRSSAHAISNTTPPPHPPLGPPIVPDPPISSISRSCAAVRASTSGHFLSVAPPQSAAREEWPGNAAASSISTRRQEPQHYEQATVRVPSHPYATLHQPSRRSFSSRSQRQHSPERQYP